MILPAGWLLLSALLLHPTLAKVCNDRTKHGQDNSWFARDGENLPIMVLMPMNESALMSSISQGIEPAVQLAIKHIRETRKYSFSLITKIYDTEVTQRFSAHLVRAGRSPLAGMCVRMARALPDWGQREVGGAMGYMFDLDDVRRPHVSPTHRPASPKAQSFSCCCPVGYRWLLV